MEREPESGDLEFDGELRAAGDAAWRELRNRALWMLFVCGFVTFVFSVGAGKRWWDSQVAQERMAAVGLTTQPMLAAPLRFEARQSRFESALFVACAAVMATMTFFAYRRFDRLRRDARMILGLCVRCGYVLEGLTEPRCPECGAAFRCDALK